MKRIGKNLRVVGILVIAGICMLCVAYASVPLYRMFCSATGYGGTTQRVAAAPTSDVPQNKIITVSFDTNVDSSLPWDFKPEIHSVDAKLGETKTVKFIAHNRSNETVTGMATFNVQPDKAGPYFDKIQCFCFDQQTLKPNETAELTVQFYVDPAIATDKDTNDVQDITLSYTFFRSKKQGAPDGALRVTSPAVKSPKTPGNPS